MFVHEKDNLFGKCNASVRYRTPRGKKWDTESLAESTKKQTEFTVLKQLAMSRHTRSQNNIIFIFS